MRALYYSNHNELELHRQNDNPKTMAILFLLFGNGHRVERMQEFEMPTKYNKSLKRSPHGQLLSSSIFKMLERKTHLQNEVQIFAELFLCSVRHIIIFCIIWL